MRNRVARDPLTKCYLLDFNVSESFCLQHTTDTVGKRARKARATRDAHTDGGRDDRHGRRHYDGTEAGAPHWFTLISTKHQYVSGCSSVARAVASRHTGANESVNAEAPRISCASTDFIPER